MICAVFHRPTGAYLTHPNGTANRHAVEVGGQGQPRLFGSKRFASNCLNRFLESREELSPEDFDVWEVEVTRIRRL